MTYPDDSSAPIRSEPPSLQPPADVPVRILVGRGALGGAVDALLPEASITAVFIGTITVAGTRG